MSDEPQRRQDQTQPDVEDELAFPGRMLGAAWGESVTQQRADELRAILSQWESQQGQTQALGPFDLRNVLLSPGHPERLQELHLTGADVFWLAVQTFTNGETGVDALVFEVLTGDPG